MPCSCWRLLSVGPPTGLRVGHSTLWLLGATSPLPYRSSGSGLSYSPVSHWECQSPQGPSEVLSPCPCASAGAQKGQETGDLRVQQPCGQVRGVSTSLAQLQLCEAPAWTSCFFLYFPLSSPSHIVPFLLHPVYCLGFSWYLLFSFVGH